MFDDEAVYAAVSREIETGHIRQGLWTKALSDTGYDEQRARAAYIKLRVKTMKKEGRVAAREGQQQHEQAQRLLERQREEEKERCKHERLQVLVRQGNSLEALAKHGRPPGFAGEAVEV
ncbi:MAG: hypothetical protein H0W34_03395 [Pyrinomonadaceae bacterium]|nr:hypothetical protein [Gammaproteobacteria bacterium]MBA3571023.1 hypothetical protein [Pyrinomonadaceae bacterium]